VNGGTHQNEVIAIKEVDLEKLEDKYLQNLNVNIFLNEKNEIMIMMSLNHPNVLKNYSTCYNNHKIYLVMQFMNQGSLQNILSYKYANGIKDISIIATIMLECVKALQYLHKNNIIHRDLKAANILMNENGHICLGDLGVAGLLQESKRRFSFVGSLAWMAPEIFSSGEGYDCKVINLMLNI